MTKDIKIFFWLLKIGAGVNIYFLVQSLSNQQVSTDPNIIIPAWIFFIVSAFRCLFPVRYRGNLIFHNSPFSSIFLTRLLATFSETALIYQLSYVLKSSYITPSSWVDFGSWLMVGLVTISQIFVWGAIFTGRSRFYFYEEFGWALIYGINTITSYYLYLTENHSGAGEFFILLNLLFGAGYIPWQIVKLRSLHSTALVQELNENNDNIISRLLIVDGLKESIRIKNQTADYKSWGGLSGMIWMTAYWATLLPVWVYLIILKF